MIWKPTKILAYSTVTNTWSKKSFVNFKDYYEAVKSSYKMPGEYHIKNSHIWREKALKYQKSKRYCDYVRTSKDYKDFWLVERRKCEQGIFVDDFFIPGDYYFFLNYCPIFNKLEMSEELPDIWDGHYHYALYLELAWLEDMDGGGTKARQKGISLVHMARIIKRAWFGRKATLKVAGFEEEYVLGEWSIMEGYKNHLNKHTGWYREFNPGELLNWEQKSEVTEGDVEKRKVKKGNMSKVKGVTTKRNFTKAVGGAALEIYATEAGIYQNLRKVKEYVAPNMKQGGVKTGMFVFMGAVGELKDAADLQEFCLNPLPYNIKSVPDTFSGSMEPVAFFFPDEWNYVYKDPISGRVIKCYDENGNSDLTLARQCLAVEEEANKKKDETSYKLWKSQHPSTLQDAFDQREDNPFPTQRLKDREMKCITQKNMIVSLSRDHNKKVIHSFSDDKPIDTLNPKPGESNKGAIEIKELPRHNAPFGLYYAGVDPIANLTTSTSKSLMSVSIWIGLHEVDGKLCEPYCVATYTGRHKNASDTYQICLDLIEFYNARVVAENNVKDFIEWIIRQGKSRLLMQRRELTVINEMSPNSTIANEYGVRTEGEFKKRCLEKLIFYLDQVIGVSFNEQTGEGLEIYGTDKVWDLMFIREMLKFTPKLNTDRLIAQMLALIGVQSAVNRHIISTVKSGYEKPISTMKSLPSPFKGQPVSMSTRMPSPFMKRK